MEKTTFEELKALLLEMLKGYPEYCYYGKVEFYLSKTKEYSVDLLIKHKIIEELSRREVKALQVKEEEKKNRWYRLTPRGIDLAISMVNLDNSEKMLNYTNKTNILTDWIRVLTIILTMLGVGQLLLISFSFIK
jgi:hypothetical protein